MAGSKVASDGGRSVDGWSGADLPLLAIALGLAFGLGEVVGLASRVYIERAAVTHVSPHILWMAPAGYATFFLLLTPILFVPVRQRRNPALAVFAFTALGFIGWIEMLPWSLHGAAVVLLALGVGVQAARLASRYSEPLRRRLRRATTALACVTLLLGVGVGARAILGERRALAGLPEATPGAPNVLLIILDTVRAKSTSLLGYDRPTTPALDSLARGGTVFETALATSPWTLPSHASMFTGRWPYELSTHWSHPLDGEEPTLAEVLSRRGYVTAGFVANLSYTSRPFGLARGFAHYEDFPVSPGQVVLSTSLGRNLASSAGLRELLGNQELLNRKHAERIRGDFIDWLDARDGSRDERPFFAFLNFFDAHEPYLPPAPYDRLWGPPVDRPDIQHRHNLLRGVNARRLGKWAMSPDEIPGELAAYEGAIAYLDAQLGGLMQDLRDRGVLDNTLVVIASDHGEHMGEHGMFEHGQSLFMPTLHVPLVIRYPGRVPAGARVDNPVTIRDIPATILDLVGLAAAEPFPGESLRRTWLDRPAEQTTRPRALASPVFSELHRGLVERDWYPIASGLDMLSLLDGGYHYICNPDGSEELYDVISDPDEYDNILLTQPVGSLLGALRRAARKFDALPTWCPPPEGEPARVKLPPAR